MWASVIVALIQFLGPILADAFKKWLDGRLKSVSASLPHPAFYGSATDTKLALLDAVYDSLWWFQFGKKAAVAACIDAVERGTIPVGSNKIEG